MDLELSEDQFALRDGLRSLLAGRFAGDRVRAGFDRPMFEELAEAGVFTLLDDGFGWADSAVVFEVLGEYCVPGPLVGCALANDGRITDVMEHAVPLAVEHLAALESVIVVNAEGVTAIDAASLRAPASEWPLDPLTPVAFLDEPLSNGTSIGDPVLAATLRTSGALLTAAYAVGMAARLTEMSVEYAKQRNQFDRPIASFQAIKHLLADMAVRTEVARAAVYAAAALCDAADTPLDTNCAVSVAKALANEAAILNGKTATQVHGGMGYTWESDVHLYLKRAWVLDTRFGSSDEHCDAVFASLLHAS